MRSPLSRHKEERIMKKKYMKILSVVMGLVCCSASLFACDEGEHTHGFGEWATVTSATCEANGEEQRSCACGATETRAIEATGHSFGGWTTVTPVSCETDGEEQRSCACGATETRTVGATGHSYATEWSTNGTHHWYAATCGHDGKDGYGAHSFVDGVCSVCDEAQPIYRRVNKDGTENPAGNYVTFGSYPQTEVVDETLTATLNDMIGTDRPYKESDTTWKRFNWQWYNYYQANQEGYNYVGNKSEYMWYQDIEYGGEKYRGVYSSGYRPYLTKYRSDSDYYSYMDNNGYRYRTVYWFKFEPILWKILDIDDGKAVIMTDLIVDSHEIYAYATQDQAIEYESAYLQTWLNEEFYNWTFNDLQKSAIITTEVDNSLNSVHPDNEEYSCANTEENVWVLSYQELIEYGFVDATDEPYKEYVSLQKVGTDYAQCQGLYRDDRSEDRSYWWTRSPHSVESDVARFSVVDPDGSVYMSWVVSNTSVGVVPVVKIQL